jgi:uncharacterized membrane protein
MLSPEERRKIYEEEKARIEEEKKQKVTGSGSTTGLEPNIAGLLCYLGVWITGIIFLILEEKNRFVRFHAMQSIVTFGTLTVAAGLLGWIPFVGGFFRTVFAVLGFILWIVLMVKAYQGELFKVPLAGEVAEGMLLVNWKKEKPGSSTDQKVTGTGEPAPEPAAQSTARAISEMAEKFGKRTDDYFKRSRAGRIAGYSATIFWNIVLIIFFTAFYQYIAWYQVDNGVVTRMPMLTHEYFAWLPILVTALAISIAANIILIINDQYFLRGLIKIILNVIGIVVVANLIAIFPFNFSVIPNPVAVEIVPMGVTIFLILIAVGLGIGAIVEFIKIIVNTVKRQTD